MIPTNMSVGVYFVLSFSTLFGLTNTRTSTMWKLNINTGKIEKRDLLEDKVNSYSSLDENMLYNFNAMADVYARDEMFCRIVSSTHNNNFSGWLRQPAENSLESLLQARKIKIKTVNKHVNSFVKIQNSENKITIRSNSQNFDTLDCGQPVNYTNYDYIINLDTQYKLKQTPIIPEPDVIYFFLHYQGREDCKNFNMKDLEARLKYFKKQNPLSAELYHHIGNYWRIVGNPVEAIKCFRRSLDISPGESEVMYDLAKVLYNIQYLDDAINMARRSIEFQSPTFAAWRQYLLLGDIMKTYGDLRESVHYYRLALELNPNQELILRSLSDSEQRPSAALHLYTIVIIVVLMPNKRKRGKHRLKKISRHDYHAISARIENASKDTIGSMVLIVILPTLLKEVRGGHYTNDHYAGNTDICDVKTQRHFNRAMAMRSLKGLPTSRYMRQRKY